MFRRFMIVCWVLFAIPAIIGVIVYAPYVGFEQEMLAYKSESQSSGTSASSIREYNAEMYFDALDYARSRAAGNGVFPEDWNQFITDDHVRPTWLNNLDLSIPDDLTPAEFSEKFWYLKDRYEKSDALYAEKAHLNETAGMLALLAGLIMLWNIICHIGHWIWMGRQVE